MAKTRPNASDAIERMHQSISRLASYDALLQEAQRKAKGKPLSEAKRLVYPIHIVVQEATAEALAFSAKFNGKFLDLTAKESDTVVLPGLDGEPPQEEKKEADKKPPRRKGMIHA